MIRSFTEQRPLTSRARLAGQCAGLLFLLGGPTACRGAAGPLRAGSVSDTAFVGVAVGLTRTERYVDVFNGVQLALDQLNATRATGTPVLAMKRAPASATSVIAVAVSFRDDPRVVGVVGHTESNATLAAAGIYADREGGGANALVAITPTAGAGAVTASSEWLFRVCPTASEVARAVARYTVDSLHLMRSAMLYRNDAGGKEAFHAFAAEYARLGGTVTERDPFIEDIPDYDAYARRITRSVAQAVIIASGNEPEERATLRALRAAGGRPVVLGWNPPETADSATMREFRGMRYTMLFSAAQPGTAEGRRFASDFRRTVGHAPDKWGALGFDAAMLIGTAVRQVGPSRLAIRDWLAGVGRDHAAYAGATGRIAFDANRDPVKKQVLIGRVGE